MARTSTITQEQINEAANTIKSEGNRPTARAVREHIGGGSMATILRMLQSWKGDEKTQDISMKRIPQSLEREILDYIEEETAAVRAEIGKELVILQQEKNDLIIENEDLDRYNKELKEEIDKAAKLLTTMHERKNGLEENIRRLENEIKNQRQAAEMARTELAKAQIKLDAAEDMKIELKEAREKIAEEYAKRTAAEQTAAVDRAKLEAAENKARKAELDAEKAEKRTEHAEKELTNARIAIQAMQTALDSAARESEQLKEQIKDEREESRKAIEIAAELRGRMNHETNTRLTEKPTTPRQKSKPDTTKIGIQA